MAQVQREELLIRDLETGQPRPYYVDAENVNLGDETNYKSLPDRLSEMQDDIDAAGQGGGGGGTVTAVQMNGESPIQPNGNGVVDLGTVITSHQSLAALFGKVAYDGTTHRINFYGKDDVSMTTVLGYIDCSPFIVEGMLSNVEVKNVTISGTPTLCMVFTFNTDAGKQDINIPVSSIFNAANYYTKTDADGRFQLKLVSGTNIKTINNTSILGDGNISIPAGQDGQDGADGKSAYQSYLDTTSDNPKKTESEWVASLKGDKGDQGDTVVLDPQSLPQFTIVNDLVTGGGGSALSAEMGKRLKEITDKGYRSKYATPIDGGSTVIEEVELSASDLGVELAIGQRNSASNVGLGQLGASGNKRACLNTYWETSAFPSSSDAVDVFTIKVPAGWYSYVAYGDTLGSVSDNHGTPWTEGENDITINKTYAYMGINFKKVVNGSDATITDADITTLEEYLRIQIEQEHEQDTISVDVDGTESIEVIDENSNVVRALYNPNDSGKVTLYTKGAIDKLLSGMGQSLDAYTSSAPGQGQLEEVINRRPISYFGNSFVRGQRQANYNINFGTIGDNSASAIRITTSLIFEKANFGDTVKVFVPAGFFMMVRQANSLTEMNPTNAGYLNGDNDGVNIMVEGGANGALHTFSLVRTYWAFWAKYGSNNATVTDQMITDLTDNCYIEQTETIDTSDPVIEIIGLNGIEKRLYNSSGEIKTTLYTKEAVDALVKSKPIRVLQYNIGHFSKGYTNGTTITSANYDEMLARWKSMIKNIDADIMGLPEYNTVFGNNGNSAVSTVNSGIFDGYNLSVGKSAAGGWWINTLASRLAMANPADKDLGSTGGNSAYARYATVDIEGKSVLIAVTHLNWASSAAHIASRAVEIQNLIKWLAKYEYVILMGDFNTDGSVVQSASKTEADFMAGASEFDAFKYYNFDEVVDGENKHYEGGFVLANHGWFGDLLTCDATGSRPDHLTDSERGNNNPDTFYNRPFCVLDNIIVKGFRMSNVQVIDDGNLTDHCGLICDLTMD